MRILVAIVCFMLLSGASYGGTTTQPAAGATTQPAFSDRFLNLVISKAEKLGDFSERVAGGAVDLAMEEAPKVAQEYITWRMWYHFSSVLNLIVPCLIILISIFVLRYSFRKARAWEKAEPKNDDISGHHVIAGIFIAIIVIFAIRGLFIFSDVITECRSGVQCIVAPRIYIAEQVWEGYKALNRQK